MQNTALSYHRFGMPEKELALESGEIGAVLGPKLRARMALSPINPSDLIPITGAYRHRIKPPLVAGYEGVGVAVSVEHGSDLRIGQRILPLLGPGTWQSFVDCDSRWAIPVPDYIDDNTAARAYINPLAAMLMLKRWNPLGQRVLMTAAGSSCAQLLAQWAFALGAKEVSGVYRSREHRATLEQLGVRPVAIDDIRELTQLAGYVDLAFDAIGGDVGRVVQSGMRKEAAFVSYGLFSGKPIASNRRGPSLARFHIRDQLEDLTPVRWHEWFNEIWQRLRYTSLPPTTCFPLANWKDALSLYRQSGRKTKPILVLS
ncbi:zinc-containing alcohol dehydrogenase superfamily protein [Caballeronia calidae]|uniref:Zinc-containing alcohol dehydrogenase superfamily protein n=1 Tax=Caballeronia calidae TaxID=1777139 RepID=A0A158E4I5_9BURK|nr:zinc-containing alcohol dehydrogenase superfamily protein [Caballeronia calidae]